MFTSLIRRTAARSVPASEVPIIVNRKGTIPVCLTHVSNGIPVTSVWGGKGFIWFTGKPLVTNAFPQYENKQVILNMSEFLTCAASGNYVSLRSLLNDSQEVTRKWGPCFMRTFLTSYPRFSIFSLPHLWAFKKAQGVKLQKIGFSFVCHALSSPLPPTVTLGFSSASLFSAPFHDWISEPFLSTELNGNWPILSLFLPQANTFTAPDMWHNLEAVFFKKKVYYPQQNWEMSYYRAIACKT